MSLWQPRGASSPVVEQFSLRTGALLSTLARYDSSQDQVSSPRPDSRGDLWITHTIGPGCSSHISVDCGPPVADSCSSTVTRLDPATGTMQPVLTFASSVLVSEAVPSPSSDLIAFVAGGCATSYFNSHFVIENLRKHRSWSIGADAEVCHSLSAPAWNRSGSKLVFTYGPSTLKAGQTYTQDFPLPAAASGRHRYRPPIPRIRPCIVGVHPATTRLQLYVRGVRRARNRGLRGLRSRASRFAGKR